MTDIIPLERNDSRNEVFNQTLDASSQPIPAARPPSAAVRPPSAAVRPPTSLLFSRGSLVSSRLGGEKATLARPSTAVRAVGYAANNGSASQRFDQFFVEKAKQKTLSSNNATIDSAKEINPQIKYKNLESKIIKLLESSIVLAASWSHFKSAGHENNSTNAKTEAKAKLGEALNKAKEAFSLDRTLHRFRDQQGENVFHNFDLTYSVFFNLAEQYENNEMYIEALNTYSIMTKNKMFPHVNQLKLNMGNIYYKMGVYPKAIKMYRMALDSVPNNLKQLRLKITQNIGILFVRMGQYADAASSFEFIMSERADVRSGIHLILCYYAMGDIEKIKSTFRILCDVQPMETDNDIENENNIIKLQQHASEISDNQQISHQNNTQIEVIHGSREDFNVTNSPNPIFDHQTDGEEEFNKNRESNNFNKSSYVFKIIKSDELAIYAKQCRSHDKRSLTMIVDLISPIIEENYNDGYNWCIEVIKTSNLSWLANELELNKALVYLRQNDINQAIETLQLYDRKKESSMTANALTNLSFIYINLGNMEMASHCVGQLSEIGALQSNAMALVNASIIDIQKQQYAAARTKLERALDIQPDNFEANYNLGLVALKENDLELAEEQFELLKNQLMNPHSVQHSHVFYQIARLQEKKNSNSIAGGNFRLNPNAGALQSYLQVLGISAAEIDSQLFEKVGSIYEQIQDHQEANQYYNEAYRINPSDINIGSSIGSYFVKLQAIEKALYFYERAVLADPNDPNLMLRIASCFRNSYLPPKQYLTMFEKIYYRFPDNLTCVRALMQVTKYLGMPELHEKYTLEYNRLNKQLLDRQNEQRYQQQRLASGRASSRMRGYRNALEEHNSSRNNESHGYMSNSNVSLSNQYAKGIDSNYSGIQHTDPLGPLPERPRTGMMKQTHSNDSEDEDINAENLLPI